MLKSWWKFVLLLPVIAAVVWEVIRLIPVWLTSPLDRWDFLWPLIGLGLLPVLPGLYRFHRRKDSPGAAAWFFLPIVLGFAAFGWWKHLHLIWFAGVVGTGIVLLWGVWGWRLAWKLTPAALLLLLGFPTSAVIMFPPAVGNWFMLKAGVAAIAAGWMIGGELSARIPKWFNGIFLLALGGYAVASLLAGSPAPAGIPVRLNLDVPAFGDLLGADGELSAFDRSFFSGCRSVRRRSYFGKDFTIGVLELQSGSSVNNIHPAEVCLLSGGWKVVDKRCRTIQLPAGELACEELYLESDGRLMLVAVWYTNGESSTGGYLRFRRSWLPSVRWYIYQVMIPVTDSRALAEKRMVEFISLLHLPESGERRSEFVKK